MKTIRNLCINIYVVPTCLNLKNSKTKIWNPHKIVQKNRPNEQNEENKKTPSWCHISERESDILIPEYGQGTCFSSLNGNLIFCCCSGSVKNVICNVIYSEIAWVL